MLGLWLQLDVPGFRLVRARGGHGRTPVAGDPLLAKSAQGVQHHLWPGLTGPAGLPGSGGIQARWCQS